MNMLVFFRSLRQAQRPERLFLALEGGVDTSEKVLVVSPVLGRSGRPAGKAQCLYLIEEYYPATVTLVDGLDTHGLLERGLSLTEAVVFKTAPILSAKMFISLCLLRKRLGQH